WDVVLLRPLLRGDRGSRPHGRRDRSRAVVRVGRGAGQRVRGAVPPGEVGRGRAHAVRGVRPGGPSGVIVIPAIDVRGGRAVRLRRGNPEEETAYDDDPVNVAVRFQTEGARRIHVIDLDAALEQGDNRDTIRDICRSVVCPVQVGGGIRTLEDIKAVLDNGA